MTDEELLLWLRIEDTNLTDFAADRIEELTAELAGARDDAKGAEAKALRAAADMTLGLSNARACRTAILAMIPKGDSHDPL